MRVIECPVCRRQYRFDESKMTKDTIRVKCRKCENVFVISRDMFSPKSPEPVEKTPSAAPKQGSPPVLDEAKAVTLVIKALPNDTARLRVATRLMSLTGEKLSMLNRKLAKTPARFHVHTSATEIDRLLRAVESTGGKAEIIPGGIREKGGRRRRQGEHRAGWRKWAVAALILTVIGGGLFAYLYKEVQKTHILEQRGIDAVIPAEACVYLRLTDLEKNWQRIQRYPVYQGLDSLLETVRSSPDFENLSFMKGDWENSMLFSLLRLKIMDLIGADIRAALYRDGDRGGSQLLLTLKGNLRIKLLETVARWISHWKTDFPIRQTSEERRLYVIQADGMKRKIYFFSEGLVYVAGTSPDLVKTSLSLVRKELPTKNSLGSISSLRERGATKGVNQLGLFFVKLGDIAPSNPPGMGADKKSASLMPFAFCGDVVGTISYGRGLVFEATMPFKSESIDQRLKTLFESRPRPNQALNYVTGNTIVYLSNNNIDLPTHLSWFRENLTGASDSSVDVGGIISEIDAKTGVDIENQLLPFLGRNVSYGITDVKNGESQSVPAMHLFVEVKDKMKVDDAIRKLLKRLPIPVLSPGSDGAVVTTDHKGTPITHLRYQADDGNPSPLLPLFTPSYAFVDRFLVITTQTESLKRIVDLATGPGQSLIQDNRFNEVRHLIGDESSGLAYVNLKAVSRLARGLLTQGPFAGFLTSNDKKAQDLLLLLQVLQTLNYVWGETDIETDRVRMMIYVSL